MQNTTLITATNSATNSNKTFTFAGISRHPDVKIGVEIRFANSAQRFAKDLGRYGHTEVRGVALSRASTKLEAAMELLANEHFADEEAQLVIQRFITKHSTNDALITA
jgi:hypothetical protein